MATFVVVVTTCIVGSGCATAGTDFRPYSASSSRAAVLSQAVEATDSDLPSLAAAGAVIVGTVITRGNGFASAEYVKEAAAVEAARHGGTHVVVGMTVQPTARGRQLRTSEGAALRGAAGGATYEPGKTLGLTALVLRLPEDTDWAKLPQRLQPEHDVYLAHDAVHPTARPSPELPQAISTAEIAQRPLPLELLTGVSESGEPLVIDASHIKPLSEPMTSSR